MLAAKNDEQKKMYLIGFILGGTITIFLLSKLVGVIVFRKIIPPKKQIFSVCIAFVLATVIAGYGIADGGPPEFVEAAAIYGIASIIVLTIQVVVYYSKRKNS
jgi:uncharacterized membrane protein